MILLKAVAVCDLCGLKEEYLAEASISMDLSSSDSDDHESQLDFTLPPGWKARFWKYPPLACAACLAIDTDR